MKETAMTQAAVQTDIRVNGQDEPLGVATLGALLEEKAVDTGQRGIAVALNGAIGDGVEHEHAVRITGGAKKQARGELATGDDQGIGHFE
jgi:sulfur carrier protein ThiS